MENICPICTTPFETFEMVSGECPHCGHPVLKNAGNIKISTGSSNPLGENNFVDTERGENNPLEAESVIYNYNSPPEIMPEAEEEESIIVGPQSAGEMIAVDSPLSRQLNMIDHTAEEMGAFDWSAMEKEPSMEQNGNIPWQAAKKGEVPLPPINHSTPHPGTATPEIPAEKTPAVAANRKIPKGRLGEKRNRTTNRTRRGALKKKPPLHFYLIFYGIPAIVTIVLMVLVWLKFKGNPVVSTVDPQKIWVQGEIYVGDGRELFYKAQVNKFKWSKSKYRKCLEDSLKFFDEGLKKCREARHKRAELDVKGEGLEWEEAFNRYPKIIQLLDDWQKERDKVAKAISEVN